MSPLIVVAGLIAAGIAVVVSQHQRGQWMRALQALAAEFDLTIDPSTWRKQARARGLAQEVPLVVDTYTTSRGKSQTRYTRIRATPAGLPADLVLKPEGFGATLTKLLSGQDLKIGDSHFDHAVVVRGDPTHLRAVLDAETRREIVAAVAQGIVVENGELVWIQRGLVTDGGKLRERARQLVRLARALTASRHREALLRIVTTERQPEVVQGALTTLLGRWQLSADEQATLLGHAEASVRLATVAGVGRSAWPGAWPVVEAIARASGEDAPLRAQALALLAQADADRAVPVALEVLSARPELPVVLGALAMLEAAATCPPLAILARLMAVPSADLRAAIARCLLHSPEPAEAQLLELLVESDDMTAIAVARALGVHGTIGAVMPLRARAQGLLVNRRVREAIDATIAELQGQVDPAIGGGLSLARAHASGGLALVGDKRTPETE